MLHVSAEAGWPHPPCPLSTAVARGRQIVAIGGGDSIVCLALKEDETTTLMNAIDTETLRQMPPGAAIVRIIEAALAAVDPGHVVRQALQRAALPAGRVRLLAVGKASVLMAEAVIATIPQQVSEGIIVTKAAAAHAVRSSVIDPRMTLIESGHPVPDAQSLHAGETIARFLAASSADDIVVVLLSGGGSALMTLPVAGVTLADIQHLNQLLLASGAPITAINTVRKHLDRVKGGGLARMAYPATLITLILSDVVGNAPDVIASGPTVADPSTYGDALAILHRYVPSEQVPPAIMHHLEQSAEGRWPETAKPGDPIFERVSTTVIGDNTLAAQAALRQAQQEGFHAAILTTTLEGEARDVGRFLASIACEMASSGNPLPRPACLIVGGETTVTLRGTGHGGRNQEVALAMVHAMAGLERTAVLTFATDGGDGPTDAAGAIVTGETWQRAQQRGCNPTHFLANNDAYTFFDSLGDLIRIGTTQTNVNDLTLIITW